ncbi:CpeS-like protein [Synechococcus sp. PCC 7502]|uniref:phycobiliprotein lyase n=1 Tax=Synechococcus sp. PCC 7502 TaxID=1173263 RepID=UPI00029F9F73|nr:phycobiliprotein lyase [Synechococcus sp. PCC 7502]AFY74846.1 CpeS-like protein [Synechococcus sp. PCC 7502]
MLGIEEFFSNCSGLWKTERTYHTPAENEVERSYTEFQVTPLTNEDKQKLLIPSDRLSIQVDLQQFNSQNNQEITLPGFAITFDTTSEKGEKVSMSLKALFVPDIYVTSASATQPLPALPTAAEVLDDAEVIKGFYLRNEGYSETGAIAGRFTYQPTRQTLEMTTYYKRSVAVDQMRFITPNLRLRTILTYKREGDTVPVEVTLVGFGLEQRYPLN